MSPLPVEVIAAIAVCLDWPSDMDARPLFPKSVLRHWKKHTLFEVKYVPYFKQKVYLCNGKKHREGAPAEIFDYGSLFDVMQIWYVNDEIHRTDGPAVMRSDGNYEWFYRGVRHHTIH